MGGGLWLCLTTAIADSVRLYGGTAAGAQCLRLSERFFIPIADERVGVQRDVV